MGCGHILYTLPVTRGQPSNPSVRSFGTGYAHVLQKIAGCAALVTAKLHHFQIGEICVICTAAKEKDPAAIARYDTVLNSRIHLLKDLERIDGM